VNAAGIRNEAAKTPAAESSPEAEPTSLQPEAN